jgi:hypothetical protein
MTRSVSLPAIVAALLGVAAFGWTNPGVSRGPVLAGAEALQGCATVACPVEARGFQTHWVSRTGNGQLYVMVRSDCAGSDCVARFVERTHAGLATRLDVQGEFRVVPSGKDVPDVEARRAVSDTEMEITRYSWVGGAYVKGETRQVFSVSGQECGSALECYQKAQAAREEKDTGKALQILETVHKVSYI